LIAAIERAVDGYTAGSPVDPKQHWTNRSPRDIALDVAREGYDVSSDTVRRILTEDLDLHLRQAFKEEPLSEHRWRAPQFQHLAELKAWYARRGWPVVSVDTKKKELLGNFFRAGAAYTDGLVRVLDHDFGTWGAGRVVPYGVYDLACNEGFVLLSRGADTSELACDAIERWWRVLGWRAWRQAPSLLLLCDCGGGNGYRQMRFKEDLKNLAIRLGREIRVAHYPPSCSKYNPIEHRLFCHLGRALRGVILQTMEVARRYLARATTATGLKVVVETTNKLYEKGRQATRSFLETLPVKFDRVIPELNYRLTPKPCIANAGVIFR
jgi:hypothetical protein